MKYLKLCEIVGSKPYIRPISVFNGWGFDIGTKMMPSTNSQSELSPFKHLVRSLLLDSLWAMVMARENDFEWTGYENIGELSSEVEGRVNRAGIPRSCP